MTLPAPSPDTLPDIWPPAPIRPDYGGGWIGAVVPALLGHGDDALLPVAAKEARRVVLLVVDGMGWSALQAHAAELPVLSGMAGGRITSVAPSTTAAGLTSLTTGVTPGEHGLVNYRIRVAGQILGVLKWAGARNSTPPDPIQTQPVRPFCGEQPPVVSRQEFKEGGFTTAHLRGGQFRGWQATSTLVEYCRRDLDAGARFVYAYYDGVDKVAHAHGLDDGMFGAELRFTDNLVAQLLAIVGPDGAVVVTADHGQVEVGAGTDIVLDQLAPMIEFYAGESRCRFLHARRGAVADLASAARERYDDIAWVFTRDEFCDEGWLGPVVRPEVRSRVGDVVLVPFGNAAFADPHLSRETTLIARHGSFTAAEMYVPLLAAPGR